MRIPRVAVAGTAALALVALPGCGPKVPGTDCPMMPHNSFWHADVRDLPTLANSDALVASVGVDSPVHPDFGSGLWEGGPIGIPFTVVDGDQERVPISFYYASQSDPGPYPIPPDVPIEGGPDADGDRHVLVVDRDACVLYEVFDAHPNEDFTEWDAGSGAIWNLRSNALRQATWTSADAAGFPILPGLVHYDEVASGTVSHVIRMTAPVTRRQFIWPATHQAGSTNSANAPAMGQWFRLGDHIDPLDFPAAVRPIVVALQTHGGIIADNGSSWFISGVPDPRWNNTALRTLRTLTGDDFEAVDASSLMVAPTSGQVQPG
jgi:hypothetical protein